MSDEYQTLFQNAVDNYVEYPSKNTVIRTALFGHALACFLKLLREKKVFHESYRSLGFVDLYEGSQGWSCPTVWILGMATEGKSLTGSKYSFLSNPED